MAIKVENLSYQINSKTLLDDVSCTFQQAKIHSVIGLNGAGKSTLLNLLGLVIKPSAGQIHFFGKLQKDYSQVEFSQLAAWMPAQLNLPFDYSCLDIVLMGRFPIHSGIITPEDRDFAIRALDQVGAADFSQRGIHSLSSGEQKKIMIARCLALNPKVLILDEPCANLDFAASLKFFDLINRLKEDGLTTILSIHDISFAKKFTDYCLGLKAGKVELSGPSQEVINRDHIAKLFDLSKNLVQL